MIKDITTLFQQAEMAHIFDQIEAQIQPCFRLDPQLRLESEIPIGSSKIGGNPDLPPEIRPINFTWRKRPLDFLLQLNLAEMAEICVHPLLPKTGMLYFFLPYITYHPFVMHMKTPDRRTRRSKTVPIQVIYSDLPCTDLKRYTMPLPPVMAPNFPIKNFHIQFEQMFSLPPESSLSLTAEEKSVYRKITQAVAGKKTAHQVLGYPMEGVELNMPLRCELEYRGINSSVGGGWLDTPEQFERYQKRLDKLQHIMQEPHYLEGSKDWLFLMQLESLTSDRLSINWGPDDGRIFFWIRKQDLQRRYFQDVWFIRLAY